VTIPANFLSGLLETDAIVLHCDERYQPCGWTAPLARTVDLKTFQNQTASRPRRRVQAPSRCAFLELAARRRRYDGQFSS
jgi:hypothetical protein